MSIKITHSRDQRPLQQPTFYKGSPVLTFDDAIMMTPQSKKLKPSFSAYGPGLVNEAGSAANEIYVLSEVEKFKKLFPLLETEVNPNF